RGYFNHESPEGASPIDRIQTAGIDGMTLAAENLGLTRESDPTLAIVRSWLNSPDHRRNLLAPAMNSTGVGITRGKDGSLLYTQLYVSIPR
ncbi:MAG: CAP domain-containing protein, partial [Myxococcota bacterium]